MESLARVKTHARACPWLVSVSLALLANAAYAQDWPQFRGPTGQGLSDLRGLPLTWSESENVAWKVPVPGRGWSSPVIAGDRVWLTTFIDKGGSMRALSFDVATGKELVNVEVFRFRGGDPISPKNSRATPTPVLDGDRVFVHFGAEGTAALDTSGKILWKAQFSYSSQHGSGGSPIVFGDLLIVSGDGPDAAFLVALDKATGKVRWKTWKRQPWDQAYSTPLAIKAGDRDEIISAGAYHAAAYDPQTGKEIWGVNYADGFSNVPRPVYGAGLVYIATGFQQPTIIAVRPDGKGDVTKTHIVWTLPKGAPLTPSPVIVGDELYLVNDGGVAICLNAKTGAPIWVQRLPGPHSASPVVADGHIYFLSEDAVTTVITAGAEFHVLATNQLDGTAYASMAVSTGSFFIRTDKFLYRIGK
jgi:outer membrane protein assembly factor BamB